MNVLITGANGQLGNELRLAVAASSFAADGSRFLFTDIADASEESLAMLRRLGGASVDTSTRCLDITDLDAVRALVREERIGAVINCAAFTNVDAAEEKQDLAELLNAKAPEHLAVAMKEAGGLLIHISTDYVFGAEPYNRPCTEDQAGTPTGVYGLTKLHGEQAIRRVGCDHVIVRTAWLYSEFGKNFVRTMLHLTATRPQLKVVFDQVGTPTYAADLASALLTILADYAAFAADPAIGLTAAGRHARPDRASYPHAGTYHFSNEGACTWYDFAKTIATLADELSGGLPSRSACDIQPCHSDEYPSPVKRPAYSVLDKTRIKAAFGLTIPHWTDSLRHCLAALL